VRRPSAYPPATSKREATVGAEEGIDDIETGGAAILEKIGANRRRSSGLTASWYSWSSSHYLRSSPNKLLITLSL
jgi:hypothetical protein